MKLHTFILVLCYYTDRLVVLFVYSFRCCEDKFDQIHRLSQ